MQVRSCHAWSEECHCHDTYTDYDLHEKVVLGQVACAVIFFGISSNLLSVKIFTHRSMNKACINWYLAVLSVSDSLVLLASFFVLTLPRLGETFQFWWALRLSYFLTPFGYGLMTLAQTASVWMTVALSVHRFIGVCYPFQAMEWLTEQRVIKLIFTVIGCSAIFNMTRFFEVRVVNNCYRKNIDSVMPVLSPTNLRTNSLYQLVFFGWAYTIVMFLIPFLVLIVVNSKVLSSIKRQNRLHRRESVTPMEIEMTRKAEIKERQTTIMLFALVVVFLACNTLALLSNVIENLGYDDWSFYPTLVTYNNFMVIVNASSNIFIFLLFSEKYRFMIRSYFGVYKKMGRMDSPLITTEPVFL